MYIMRITVQNIYLNRWLVLNVKEGKYTLFYFVFEIIFDYIGLWVFLPQFVF
jgi:hypothetical protein